MNWYVTIWTIKALERQRSENTEKEAFLKPMDVNISDLMKHKTNKMENRVH